jgi:hypothetical protein
MIRKYYSKKVFGVLFDMFRFLAPFAVIVLILTFETVNLVDASDYASTSIREDDTVLSFLDKHSDDPDFNTVCYQQYRNFLSDVDLKPLVADTYPSDTTEKIRVLGETTSSSISPSSDACRGYEVEADKVMLCSESSTELGVDTGDGETLYFDEDCQVKLVFASYPAHFAGIDPEPQDGRVFVDYGDFPAIADAWGITLDSECDGETCRVGDRVHHAPLAFSVPNELRKKEESGEYSREELENEANLYFEIDVNEATTDGQANTQQAPPGGGQDSATYDCPGTYSPGEDGEINPSSNCESTVGVNTQAEATNFPGAMRPPNYDPELDNSYCPDLTEVERVPYRILCLDIVGLAQGWIHRFTGNAPRGKCMVDHAIGTTYCRRAVGLTIYAEDIMSEDLVEYRSFLVSAGKPPVVDEDEEWKEGEPVRSNFPEEYVATPGVCSVCGQYTMCWIMWHDYRESVWEQYRNTNIPCTEESTDRICDFEEYSRYIEEASGGIDPDKALI